LFPNLRNLRIDLLRRTDVPEQHAADSQPDPLPDVTPTGSLTPDNAAEPVEMQSPEGQLPLDDSSPDETTIAPDVAPPEELAVEIVPEVDDSLSGDATVDEAVLLLGPGPLPAAEELAAEAIVANEDQAPPVAEAPPDESQEPDALLPAEPSLVVKEPRRLPRDQREAVERQRRRFAACGRCGYFVADCCLLLGEETVQDAILDADDGWLRLEGDLTFRRLLQNAYGIQLDAGYDHFDGSCPECRRRFVYMEQADVPTRLKLRTNKPY
jgi:hypothetical protein